MAQVADMISNKNNDYDEIDGRYYDNINDET
jgi:hypothetical protein